MRRFLSRTSVSNRLIAMLALSVVGPGVVLGWYGVQAVLQEETLYEATLRERAEVMATLLQGDLGERMRGLLADLDSAAEGSDDWVDNPASGAAQLMEAEALVEAVLVLDTAGKLRHPDRAATSLFDRQGGQSADRAYLGPYLGPGEELEFRAADWTAAAQAYDDALGNIPGQRGRGIAQLARARSLLKAGDYDAAVADFDDLAAQHAGDLDLNDFPLDLLARLQSAVALQRKGDEVAAAQRLVELLGTLVAEPWTFGGYGETALGNRALAMMKGTAGQPGLLEALPDAERPDLEAMQRRVATNQARQADQTVVLSILPALSDERPTLDARANRFEPAAVSAGERSLLFAQRWWRKGNQGRQLLVLLDGDRLRADISATLTAAARANPEFISTLERSDSGLVPDPAKGFRVMTPLDPWLPGYTLVVTRGEALLGPARQQQRIVRLGMIGVLLIIILVGMVVIARAVNREVEIARMKSDFVSNVSHELRTPLTTIRIMAEMLALGAVPSGAKQAEYHRNIVSEAERLTRLINNVLDFARIEEGRKKFQFGMGDLADAVFEVERITGDYVRKEGFELVTEVADDLPPTAFDRDAVMQALINLMSNAVKYSRDEKRIEMGARVDRDTIVMWVTDHGPGIDPKEVPHLFEKFYRSGDHMTREVGGTGLGLSIVQHIVAAHGGRMNVRTKVGEGATFEIILPVQQVEDIGSAEKRR